ncbi:MAG: BRCT domain-containing protein [Limnohabitans sp.]
MAVATKPPLAGETVVVTGVVTGLTRDEVFNAVYAAGGLNGDSVNAKTTLLVIGDRPGASKLTKAAALGTPTITEAEFRRRIGR